MSMTERDRKVLMAVIGLVLVGALWFLLISPKRAAVAEAEKAKADAQVSLDTAKQAEAAAKAVKIDKPEAYAKVIRLGAAIPADDDFNSLLVQVNDIADDADVSFVNLTVSTGGGSGQGATAGVGGTSCDADGSTSSTGSTGAAPAPAPAPTGGTGSTAQTWVGKSRDKALNAKAQTEASDAAAAQLACSTAPTLADLSAQAAGLPVYHYSLTFKGSFFDLDTMFGELLGMVKSHNGRVSVNGRLLDINGINLTVDNFPALNAAVQMTGYSMPNQAPAATAPTAPIPSTGTPAASTTPAG